MIISRGGVIGGTRPAGGEGPAGDMGTGVVCGVGSATGAACGAACGIAAGVLMGDGLRLRTACAASPSSYELEAGMPAHPRVKGRRVAVAHLLPCKLGSTGGVWSHSKGDRTAACSRRVRGEAPSTCPAMQRARCRCKRTRPAPDAAISTRLRLGEARPASPERGLPGESDDLDAGPRNCANIDTQSIRI